MNMIDCKKDIAEGCETLQVKFERMNRAPFGLVRIHSFASLLKRTQAALSELHEKAEHCAALYDKARMELECETKARLFLLDQNKELKRQLVEKDAQYADAVSRWAGLARLWQEEHGGGLVYVTSEERKVEENENVALEAAAVSSGCAAEGTETGADCDPSELAGQGNAGASAGEQGDGIPKG